MKTPEEIIASNILKEFWYYSIELAPNLYTPGQMHKNIALTRLLAGRCLVQDKRCLDIGTMEAAMPVLLKRRGAKSVTAVDMHNFSQKIALVQENSEVEFNYLPGVRLDSLVPLMEERGEVNFDLVVLSGVLYHVFNPMRTLGIARSLVRPGGILLVETAAVVEDSLAMYYNDAGHIYFDWTSFWFITVPCLDAMLRYFKLSAVDCVYLEPSSLGGKMICRIAVACRAVDEPLPLPGDQWMMRAANTFDYADVRWDLGQASRDKSLLPYDESRAVCKGHVGIEACDLAATLKSVRPLEPADDQIRISLDALN